MRFEVSNLKLSTAKLYRGWIIGHHIRNGKLYIDVELDECPGTTFIKVVPTDTNPQSLFVRLAENLQLFTDDGYIETDYLNDTAIICNLQRGGDHKLYVQRLELDEQYYTVVDDDEEDTDDDNIYDEE